MKRWHVGEKNSHSWALVGTLIVLFLVQLLIMPSAVRAATANNDTVAPVNVAPSFTKGADQTVLEDCGLQTVAGWASAISAGPSNEAGQTLDFVVTNDNNALFSVQPTVAANGTLTYMPATNGNGMATVTVSLHDNGGTVDGGVNTSTPQTFTITPVNHAPVAVPDSYTTAEDTVLIVAAPGVLANDTDVDGQALTAAIDFNNYPKHGTAVLGSDGSLTYTPDLNYCGSDSFKYRASDGVVWTTLTIVSLQVTAVNHPPYGITLSKATITENLPAGTQVGYFLTQDIDSTVGFTYSVSGPGAAVLAMTNGNYLVTTQALDHEAQPAYTLHVRTTDAGGLWYETDFVISVTDVNDVPSFTKGPGQTVAEDCGPQTVKSWATSISAGPVDEAGQALDFIVTNDNNPLFAVQPAVATNGTLTYTPAANANGTATVTVRIHDDGGVDTSVAQTFTITVTAVNDPPVNTYTLTYTAGANGTISGTSPQTVNQGASSNAVTATPDAGYHFVSWSDGVATAARTDTNVTANVNVSASFAINTYTIVASASANGNISPSGDVTVNYGSSQSFTINPSTGYHVLDILVDGSSVNAVTSYTFTNVRAAHTIAASFAINTYTLTSSVTGSGSISKSPDQTFYDHGTSVQLTATPATYWHFVGWSGDLTSSGNPATITIDGNKTITATFAVDTFAIMASAGANGNISLSGDVTVNYGSSQSFTINPSTGYHVQDVLVDGSSVNAVTSYTFTNVRAAHTIAASFAINPITISTYTLTYTAGANGTISGTSPQTVNQGASGTAVTATPDAGYHFVSWSDGVATAARTDTNVTVNVNVSASFAININININIHRYTLTANVSGSGSVAKSPDQSSYTHGISVQLMATPATGWYFVGWSGDLSGTTNPATITMDVSKTVTATYAPLPHPVSRHTMVLTIDIKTMTVDSARVVLEAPAAIVEDRTLVPLRAVVEHLGGSIVWDAKTRQVTLKARGITISLTIGKSTALVNGKSLAIDPKNSKVVPVLSSSRTMLPLRFVSENLGLQVGWDAKTRTITVNWED